MDTRERGARARRRWWGLVLPLLGVCGAAGAAPAPVGPAVTGGSYTVSYARCGGCVSDWLEERAGGGAWQYVGTTPITFTNKPAGQYAYRVAYLYPLDPYYFTTWLDYGAELAVTVAGSVPPVDSLDIQRGYRYETRYGDGNGDGRLDLFVNRVAGGVPGNGALDSLLLLQNGAGGFSTAVPSAAQTSAARGWPQAAVQVVLTDFNVDGYVDLLLKNVGGALGTGVANQIVYAPGRPLTEQPLGLRAVDDRLKRFVANAHAYLADTTFFEANAPTATVYLQYPFEVCPPSYDLYAPASCYWFYMPVPVTVADYSGFDSAALAAWNNETAVQGGSATADQATRAIEHSFEDVLGVPIGGWDFGGIAGERGRLDDPTYRRGFELFLAVLGLFDADAQELDPAHDPARRPDVVYVTGRHVLGFLPLHTALEYGGTTVSAHDSDASLFGNGLLVSQVNWPSDRPPLMMTLGTVASALGAPGYWTQVLASDARYRDNLPYDPVPTAGSGRYNSNGYVNGMIQATAGVPSIDVSRFVGARNPVPPSAFH